MGRQPIRILLVEDHPIYRMGLRLSLNYSSLSGVIVGETEDVRSTKQFLEQHGDEVDIILLDYFLPDGDGVDVIHYAQTLSPKAKIVLLSGDSKNPEVVRRTQGLVDDFWDKNEDPEAMKAKLNALFGINNYDEGKQYRISVKSDLSRREIEIIQLCANGMSAQQIADRLGISRRTVEVHKSHIFEKLDINTTADLVKYAYDAGLVK
ncbi:MAG: response regulator transcription factor [Bacteroidales bacterium]|nr:response regulator transcription factor [Bacteroidales bacterium]